MAVRLKGVGRVFHFCRDSQTSDRQRADRDLELRIAEVPFCFRAARKH